jgi:hypothetical protein
MDILAVWQVVHMRTATYTKGASWAVFHIGNVCFLLLKRGLAEAFAEQTLRYSKVFLTYPYIYMLSLGMHHASLCPGLHGYKQAASDAC